MRSLPNLVNTPQNGQKMAKIPQKYPKNAIVNAMHDEVAYTETAKGDIIQFKYAKELSLD